MTGQARRAAVRLAVPPDQRQQIALLLGHDRARLNRHPNRHRRHSCPSPRPRRLPHTGSRGSVARNVHSSTSTPSTGAADSSRAAVFTTSPTASTPAAAPTDTSASPVVTPTRTRSRSSPASASASASPSRIRKPQRTARSASSSWATTAAEHRHHPITGELRHHAARALDAPAASSAWYGARKPSTSSTSRLSDRRVNPTRSANRTDTTRRSRRSATRTAASGDPQPPQNRNPSGFPAPHCAQSIIAASLRTTPSRRGREETPHPWITVHPAVTYRVTHRPQPQPQSQVRAVFKTGRPM